MAKKGRCAEKHMYQHGGTADIYGVQDLNKYAKGAKLGSNMLDLNYIR